MKKTLIVNGSPRPQGDTAALIAELKKYLEGEIVEVSAFRNKIHPCVDCRSCQKDHSCVVRDDMDLLYVQDYDNVVIAYPVYYCNAPGPVWSLLSRFQCYHELLKDAMFPPVKEKRAAAILVGGGTHNAHKATAASWVFQKMTNGRGMEQHTVICTNTDEVSAAENQPVHEQIKELAQWLNHGENKHEEI